MKVQDNVNTEVRLAKPGAGLPFLEWAVAKYIIFPARFRRVSKTVALNEFELESKAISVLSANLSAAQMGERRLIPRIQGLEDSSRYWSVSMTVQHMIIVSDQIKDVIIRLSAGDTSMAPTSIAQVKPPLEVDPKKVLADFETMSRVFLETVSRSELENFPGAKYKHPWFGELNASQWLCFAAPHLTIHRKQISEIIKRL